MKPIPSSTRRPVPSGSRDQDQAAWIADHSGLRVEQQDQTLPAGEGPTYHDGGYYALISK
jgi:hypothetical protein